jgi:hypothetical protein
MPSTDEHIAKAKMLEEFAADVKGLSGQPRDWCAVLLHYSAIHWVEAYLAHLDPKCHPRGHEARQTQMNKYPEFSNIWPQYRFLKDSSSSVRYKCQALISDPQLEFIQKSYDELKSYLLSKLP